MGQKLTVIEKEKLQSSNNTYMRKHYGDKVLLQHKIWEKYGFPLEGTMSVKTLAAIEERMAKRSLKTRQKIDSESFGKWVLEAQLRESRQNKKVQGSTKEGRYLVSLSPSSSEPTDDLPPATALALPEWAELLPPSSSSSSRPVSSRGASTSSQFPESTPGPSSASTSRQFPVPTCNNSPASDSSLQAPRAPPGSSDFSLPSSGVSGLSSPASATLRRSDFSLPSSGGEIQPPRYTPVARGPYASLQDQLLCSTSGDAPCEERERDRGDAGRDGMRLRSGKVTGQFPMLEVPDGYGHIQLVRRNWSPEEIREIAKDLPRPEEVGGEAYSEAVDAFIVETRCTSDELKKIMFKQIGLGAKWDKIKHHFPQGSLHLVHADYHNRSNYEFTRWWMDLTDKLLETFPVRMDMQKVNNCRQNKDEPVMDFLARLRGECEKYMGIRTDDRQGAFEAHLKTYFLMNMHDTISTEIKKNCVGWKNATLEMISEHAKHIEELSADKKDKIKKKEQETVTRAMLAMINSVAKMEEENNGGRTNKGGQGRNRKKGACRKCNKHGHWYKDCPLNKNRENEEDEEEEWQKKDSGNQRGQRKESRGNGQNRGGRRGSGED